MQWFMHCVGWQLPPPVDIEPPDIDPLIEPVVVVLFEPVVVVFEPVDACVLVPVVAKEPDVEDAKLPVVGFFEPVE